MQWSSVALCYRPILMQPLSQQDKVKVQLIVLVKAYFQLTVALHAVWLSGTLKGDRAIINVVSYTCAFPAMVGTVYYDFNLNGKLIVRLLLM